jgi:endonuclease-3
MAVWTPEDIEWIVTQLEKDYGKSRRIARFDPIEELVSCILSQHTTDATSFPAFTQLRETYPSWSEVVSAGPERIAQIIRKAGLANQKSRSIIGALQSIHERVGSFSLELLRDMDLRDARKWLMELPGVGPKTASIVLCFSFGKGAIPVDTHVFRVGWRLGLYEKKIGESKAHDVLLEVVPAEWAFRYHVAIIQHGRKVCKAPKPLCDLCRLRHRCDEYTRISRTQAS